MVAGARPHGAKRVAGSLLVECGVESDHAIDVAQFRGRFEFVKMTRRHVSGVGFSERLKGFVIS